MDVLILTVFVSMFLAVGAVLLLMQRIQAGDLDHSDRLSLLPLEEDAGPGGTPVRGRVASRSDRPEPEGE